MVRLQDALISTELVAELSHLTVVARSYLTDPGAERLLSEARLLDILIGIVGDLIYFFRHNDAVLNWSSLS